MKTRQNNWEKKIWERRQKITNFLYYAAIACFCCGLKSNYRHKRIIVALWMATHRLLLRCCKDVWATVTNSNQARFSLRPQKKLFSLIGQISFFIFNTYLSPTKTSLQKTYLYLDTKYKRSSLTRTRMLVRRDPCPLVHKD